jgi:hypothetical protein
MKFTRFEGQRKGKDTTLNNYKSAINSDKQA